MSPHGRRGGAEYPGNDTPPDVVAMARQVVACAAIRGCTTEMDVRIARDTAVAQFDRERCRRMARKRARCDYRY